MDFKKIEIIFLTVFLSIDIFLFLTIIQTPSLSTSSTATKESGIRTEMKADNISAPKLSNESMTGYYLASKVSDGLTEKIPSLSEQRVSYDKTTHILSSKLNSPLNFDNRKNLIKDLESFKNNSKNIINGSKYIYSSALSSTNEIVFVQKTDYGKIVDNTGTLHFYTRDNTIIGYTQSYQENVVPVREKQEAISSRQAVNYLYMYSELPTNSLIKWTKLGYTKMTEVKGSIIYLPTWVIGVENKNTKNLQIKRVNALNGTIINNITIDTQHGSEAS